MEKPNNHDLWAVFRFAVIGPLLVAPPQHKQLKKKLQELAAMDYIDPVSKEKIGISFSTIERWYYEALSTQDPYAQLRRKVRRDAGIRPSISEELKQAIILQYEQYPGWSYKLHYDNLQALAKKVDALGKVPAYHTVRRQMKDLGLIPIKRKTDQLIAFANKEVRSFEVEYINALWHADFHHGSRKVLTADGYYVTPKLLAIMDDKSRLACHVQWYLEETAEVFIHGLTQAILKRGLPRALLTDNGSAMLAAETKEGLERMGIVQYHTLANSPYQNGKQESFFRPVKGRLLAMLEHEKDLVLSKLNFATQAWVEGDYNRNQHRQLNKNSPLEVWLKGPDVSRSSPDLEKLKDAFTHQITRRQRRSDGTISIKNIRFEIPSRFNHLSRITIRYASWDLRKVAMFDPLSGTKLCRLYPIDMQQNANRTRRLKEKPFPLSSETCKAKTPAPYLEELIQDYKNTGLPAGYLPLHDSRNVNPEIKEDTLNSQGDTERDDRENKNDTDMTTEDNQSEV